MAPKKTKPPDPESWEILNHSNTEPTQEPDFPSYKAPSLSEIAVPILKQSSYNLFNGFKEGLGVVSIIPKVFRSDRLMQVEEQVFKANMIYLGIGMLMDFINDLLVDDASPEETGWMTRFFIGVVIALNVLVFIRFLLNNSIDNMSVASASRKEKLPHLDEHNCLCEMDISIPGLLNDPVTNFFSTFRLSMLTLIPVIGPIGARIYGSIVYGNALIQAKLSMCLDHRREYISKHFFSVMGYGAAFLFLTELAYRSLGALTGRNGFLIYDALFTLIYQQYIIHAHVAELDFHSDLFGIDASYLDRRRADAYLSDLAPKITGVFTNNDNRPSSFPREHLESILHSTFVRSWLNLDLRSLEKALTNPSLRLFTEMIKPTLMITLDELEKIPANKGVWLGNKLHKWSRMVGLKIPGTEIAAIVRNLTKKGYFEKELLDSIRDTLKKAITERPTRSEDNFEEPVIQTHRATHTQHPQTFAMSYASEINTGMDGKKGLTTQKTADKLPSFRVTRSTKKDLTLNLHQDYDGMQKQTI